MTLSPASTWVVPRPAVPEVGGQGDGLGLGLAALLQRLEAGGGAEVPELEVVFAVSLLRLAPRLALPRHARPPAVARPPRPPLRALPVHCGRGGEILRGQFEKYKYSQNTAGYMSAAAYPRGR